MRMCPCKTLPLHPLLSQQRVWVSCCCVSRVIRADFLEEGWRRGLWLDGCMVCCGHGWSWSVFSALDPVLARDPDSSGLGLNVTHFQ